MYTEARRRAGGGGPLPFRAKKRRNPLVTRGMVGRSPPPRLTERETALLEPSRVPVGSEHSREASCLAASPDISNRAKAPLETSQRRISLPLVESPGK